MSKWWNRNFDNFARQLTKGALNEMKKRIENTKIQGETLQLGEASERMRDFFHREIKRCNKRNDNLAKKLLSPEIGKLRTRISQLEKDVSYYKQATSKYKERCRELDGYLKSIRR
jgi:hypothetical protein